MKKTRFSESQIISILKEGESGAMTVPELCRLHGVGQSTYYKWKSKYGGMQASDLDFPDFTRQSVVPKSTLPRI
jgi:putative transposase